MGPRVFVDAKILRRHEKTVPKDTVDREEHDRKWGQQNKTVCRLTLTGKQRLSATPRVS